MSQKVLLVAIIAMVLLAIALVTLGSAKGMTIPLFSEIAKTLQSFLAPGVAV